MLLCFKNRVIEFRNKEGFVSHILITIDVPNTEHWPVATLDAGHPAVAAVKFREPSILRIREEIRSLEDLLAVFGVHSIDTDRPEEEWLPANPEEKAALGVFSAKFSRETAIPSGVPDIPFDLMARAVLASYQCKDIVPFAFYRAAHYAMYEEQFLIACLNFTFLFETLYANGKYASNAVKAEFRKSQQLQDAINRVLSDTTISKNLNHRSPDKYTRHIKNKSSTQVSDYLVYIRGFIHHHSINRPQNWHPRHQQELVFEAELLYRIAHDVVAHIAVTELNSDTLPVAQIRGVKRSTSS